MTSPEPTVLFISLPSVMGGSVRSLVTVLRGLEGRCRRVVATPDGTWLAALLAGGGLADEVIRLPGLERSRWWRGVAAAKVAAWALRHRRDLVAVHANGLAELNLAVGAHALTRRPVIVWAHDWQLTPWARRLVPTLARVTRATFAAVSGAAAATLAENGLVPTRRLTVIPNPIDPADVLTSGRGARQDRVQVGYLGAPATYKGFELLPAIARRLAAEPAQLVVFAGPESELPAVWAELRAISDPPVAMPGPRSDVRDAYVACDVVLCPSLDESFGRVAAEAMLNGLPVVASDLPALREVVGDAGLLFPPGDTAAAAAAVARLAGSVELRRDLGQRGIARASRFAPIAIVDELAGLYGLRPR